MVPGHEHISGLTVPADDGSIAVALKQLDTRLAEWSTAMRAAQESLTRQSAACRQTHSGDSETDAGGENPLPAAQAMADAAVAEGHDPGDRQTPSDERPEVTKGPAEPSCDAIDVVHRAPADTKWTPAQVSEKLAACARQSPASIEPPAAPKPPDEDEALLASLEPETAKAIRVMRRLGMEDKSVRELLTEYEASKQKGKDKRPQKRSFFSRGW